MKFRKKPVIVEAKLYNGENAAEIWAWMGKEYPQPFVQSLKEFLEDTLTIKTLEGDLTAQVGDWIIRGIKGEFYPCKPDIFEATYEAVE